MIAGSHKFAGPLLEAHELTKRYRRTVAVRDLSATIPAAGITALLGPERGRQVDAPQDVHRL